MENLGRCAFFWQISSDLRKYVGKYQKKWEDLWANIRSSAKICGQISADAQNCFGKYQQTCEDLWAQSGVGTKYHNDSELLKWRHFIVLDRSILLGKGKYGFKLCTTTVFSCSNFLSADLTCLNLSLLNFKVILYTNCKVRTYTNCEVRPYTNCKVRPYNNS